MNQTIKSPHGFTLIELIFVVVLLAMLSSVAIPSASNLLGINLRSGATHVAGYLRSSYEQSVMRHEKIRVRFDLTKNSFWAETYREEETTPLMDENTKIDEALEEWEDRLEQPTLTAEEELAIEQERYKKVEDGSLKTTSLPRGIKFKGIYVASEGRIVETGAPWVEFTPGGFTPKAIVYVANSAGTVYSVILQPIGGRSVIERGEIRPDES